MEILTTVQILAIAPYFAAILGTVILALVFSDGGELF
jgi:hypothetical protein